jgi:hypothetical protein
LELPIHSGANGSRPVCIQQEHLLLSREYLESRGNRLSPSAIPTVLHLEGPLDVDVLERAVETIVRRHAGLRAGYYRAGANTPAERSRELRSFAESGVFRPGLYRQKVMEEPHVRLRVLKQCDPDSQPVEAVIREEASIQFDHQTPPLLRGTLVQAGSNEHYLILVVDHLVTDMWSMRVVRRELQQIYSQIAQLGEARLAPPGLSYPDYAEFQREMATSGGFANGLGYWRKEWSEFSSSRISFTDLPFALPPPPAGNFLFGAEVDEIDPEMTRAIRSFARQVRVTLYMLFAAVYAVVLRHYTEKPKMAIWGHFANRMRPVTRDSVGWFANTHLIGINGGNSVRETLPAVRRSVLNAHQHQEVPVGLVWRSMGGYPRDPDARVLLDLHAIDEIEEPGPLGLRIQHLPRMNPTMGRFSNLGLYIRDEHERMTVSIQYASDRFPADAIRRVLADFRREIENLIA